MSYILDALKKAAEQRGANATVLLRPSAPLARVARFGRLPWIVVGGLLLLNLAGLVYLWRPVSVVTPAPAPVAQAKVALIQPIEPPPPSPPTQVIPADPPRAAVAVKPPMPSTNPAPAASAPAANPAAPGKTSVDRPVGDKTVVRVTLNAPRPPRLRRPTASASSWRSCPTPTSPRSASSSSTAAATARARRWTAA